MRLTGFYPVLLADDPAATARFFVEHLGFRPTFESDWYVSLVHRDSPTHELAFIRPDHDSIPAAGRGQAAAGLLLNLEVADATAEHDRLQAAGVPIVQPLRDDPTGQRHFILRAPGGLLVDVIEPIPPQGEFAAQYVEA